MRSRIVSPELVTSLVCLSPQVAEAQIATFSPLEWAALAKDNELIDGQVEKRVGGQTQTVLLQNSITIGFNQVHKWEKQYNNYLKTVSGYASSLRACTHLYSDGVRTLLMLRRLGKAIQNDLQDIVVGINMNNLRTETVTELALVFTLLNNVVTKGNSEDMLTGAKRSKTLWALNDQLLDSSRKLHLFYLSIWYCTFSDVWNNVAARMPGRDNDETARVTLSHWYRAAVLI